MDGVFFYCMVFLFEFYVDVCDEFGLFNFEMDMLQGLICVVNVEGLLVVVYVIGDVVVCCIFDVFEMVVDLIVLYFNCIEYIEVVDLDDVLCFVEFGVVVLMYLYYCISGIGKYNIVCFG